MKKVIIIGSGGHAKVCLDILRYEYEIAGIIDEYLPPGSLIHGYTVLGNLQNLFSRYDATVSLFLAFGFNYLRSEVGTLIGTHLPQAHFATAIHPGSCIAPSVTIGEGSVVMPGSILNPGVYLGKHCIVNSGAIVEHDSTLADFSSLAPGALTGGNVQLGFCSFIGLGAMVLHQKKIGSHTVIGAGSVVTENIPDNRLAYGNPCKVIRSRQVAEKYL